jgi:hypothetical protein
LSWFDDLWGTSNSTATNKTTSTSKSNTTNRVETGPEQWVRDEGREATNLAISSLPTSFQAYGGNRVADFGWNYQHGKDVLGQMETDEANTYAGSVSRLDQLWNNASKALTTDARGYMNPYTEAVLNPQLRKLDESRKLQLNEDRRAATMAGAYGDPQAGIAKSLSNDRYNTLVADTTNKTYSDAYEKGRLERESDLGRLYTGQNMRRDLDQSHFNNKGQLVKANVGFGLQDQAQSQKHLDVAYDNWRQQQGWRVNRAQTINNLLNITPKSNISVSSGSYDGSATGNGSSTTPVANQGANVIGQAAGAALGGGFGEKLGDWLFS